MKLDLWEEQSAFAYKRGALCFGFGGMLAPGKFRFQEMRWQLYGRLPELLSSQFFVLFLSLRFELMGKCGLLASVDAKKMAA